MAVRPTRDQVLSLAPDRAAASAALPLAVPGAWSAAGCDDAAVWGQYVAASAEPYDVAIDLSDDIGGPAYRCNCPSRKIPCKHGLGLLLLHANGSVAPARRPPFAAEWLRRRASRPLTTAPPVADVDPGAGGVVLSHDGDESGDAGDGALGGGARAPRHPIGDLDPVRQKRQLERAARMRAGLQELDRWLADRIRVGLAAAELSDPATWERVAARLVDAQCGGLANRVKRVAVKVGQHPRWHEDVLEEMAFLHVLADGAQRTSSLPADLADGVQVATGLIAARGDVLASVPSTARWIVAGESRTREDRITVQRTWLAAAPTAWSRRASGGGGRTRIARGGGDGGAGDIDGGDADRGDGDGAATWAMVLAFGAFGNEVTSEFRVGTAFDADIHWYPGGTALRALVGRTHGEAVTSASGPPISSVAEALGAAGWSIAAEPWLERYPICIRATPAPLGNGRWAVADETGSVPVATAFARMAEIVSVSGGLPVTMMGEWSVDGFTPLTLFANDALVTL